MIKCIDCGGTNIQSRAWINVNTNDFLEWCDDEEFFCMDCDDLVDVETDEED